MAILTFKLCFSLTPFFEVLGARGVVYVELSGNGLAAARRERAHPPPQFVDFNNCGLAGLPSGQFAVSDCLKDSRARGVRDLAGFVGTDRKQG
jgi:hypothetical protein